MTGRQGDFGTGTPARLVGDVMQLREPLAVQFNGRPIGTVQPGQKGFAFDVPADRLRRLNVASIAADRTGSWKSGLSNVRLEWDGKTHYDQRHLFAWGYQPVLRPGNTRKYFDLAAPAGAQQWEIRKVDASPGQSASSGRMMNSSP